MSEPSPTFDFDRLRQLIAERCSRTLTPDAHDELELILAESAAARAVYQERISIHAGLGWEFAGKAACDHEIASLVLDADKASCVSTRSIGVANRSNTGWWVPAVAGCLLLTASIFGLVRWIGDHPLAPLLDGATNVPQVLGTLTPLLPDTQWSFGVASEHNPSSFVAGETVLLNKGAAQLRLSNGTTAQMEAPVILQMISINQARVLRGRITFDVAEGGEHFKVETASAEVVDLGTSFSVKVGDRATDVVVFEGKVDLKVASQQPARDAASPPIVQRMRMGEGIRVGSDGTLSRIVQVRRTEFTSEHVRAPLIRAVRDNLARDSGSWDFYEIVPGGMREDAPAFVDRLHEWNGADTRGMPPYLIGGDYVKTFNNDKITKELALTMTLDQPAIVYLLIDKRMPPPRWVRESFDNTGDVVGVDEAWPDPADYAKGTNYIADVGPGKSVDNTHTVWKRVVRAGGDVQLGSNAPLPSEVQTDGEKIGVSMYGIVVTPLGE